MHGLAPGPVCRRVKKSGTRDPLTRYFFRLVQCAGVRRIRAQECARYATRRMPWACILSPHNCKSGSYKYANYELKGVANFGATRPPLHCPGALDLACRKISGPQLVPALERNARSAMKTTRASAECGI